MRRAVAGLIVLTLAGCGGAPAARPYWAIAPSSHVRNAPLPVPLPRAKPEHVPSRLRQSAARVRVAGVGRARPAGASRRPDDRSSPSQSARLVRVRSGDTVYGISRRHHVDLGALVAVNRLKPPYRLRPGQRLVLPAAREYRVRSGDTLFSIARRFDVPQRTLAVANRLRQPFRLRPGQKLVIPTGRGEGLAVAGRAGGRLGPPPALAAGGFDWPVTGRVISRFGPKAQGLRNDGINVAAPHGAPVRAAQAGVVAYAGDGLEAFGRLVLIRHAGGWVSAYAHNDALLVRRGERVRRGQIIARVGATGFVDRPQLHFELRRGKTPLDPLRYLPRLTAAAGP